MTLTELHPFCVRPATVNTVQSGLNRPFLTGELRGTAPFPGQWRWAQGKGWTGPRAHSGACVQGATHRGPRVLLSADDKCYWEALGKTHKAASRRPPTPATVTIMWNCLRPFCYTVTLERPLLRGKAKGYRAIIINHNTVTYPKAVES